jgi:LmbE family N-acetylglucosaminyl deacetylase
MQLTREDADIYVPDGVPLPDALMRTTHLGIGAHQDDLEVMSYAGIAACFHSKQKWFGGIVTSNGAGSSRRGVYADFTDEEMRRTRIEEQRKAAHMGNFSAMFQLMYPSADIKDAEDEGPARDIQKILSIAKPEVVYLHNPADKHDSHIATLLRSIDGLRALAPADRPKEVYGCEVWRDLDWLCDDDKKALESGDFPHLSAALIGLFDSQVTGGKRYDLAIAGRRRANATFFNSHAGDDSEGLSWAIDLMPLVNDPSLSLVDYTLSYIDRFKHDVKERLNKFS